MQELLGRIAALDPDASLGIRVISCFDELILGRVNTDALLRTAAALAGCPAGFQADRGSSTRRIGPEGRPLQGPAPGRRQQVKRLFTVERGVPVGGGSCGVGVSA